MQLAGAGAAHCSLSTLRPLLGLGGSARDPASLQSRHRHPPLPVACRYPPRRKLRLLPPAAGHGPEGPLLSGYLGLRDGGPASVPCCHRTYPIWLPYFPQGKLPRCQFQAVSTPGWGHVDKLAVDQAPGWNVALKSNSSHHCTLLCDPRRPQRQARWSVCWVACSSSLLLATGHLHGPETLGRALAASRSRPAREHILRTHQCHLHFSGEDGTAGMAAALRSLCLDSEACTVALYPSPTTQHPGARGDYHLISLIRNITHF